MEKKLRELQVKEPDVLAELPKMARQKGLTSVLDNSLEFLINFQCFQIFCYQLIWMHKIGH